VTTFPTRKKAKTKEKSRSQRKVRARTKKKSETSKQRSIRQKEDGKREIPHPGLLGKKIQALGPQRKLKSGDVKAASEGGPSGGKEWKVARTA